MQKTTSITAFNHQSLGKRKTDILSIFAYLKKNGPSTREDIMQSLGMCSGTACARTRDCIRGNLVFENGTKKTSTGRSAKLLHPQEDSSLWDLRTALTRSTKPPKTISVSQVKSILDVIKASGIDPETLAKAINKELS